MNAYAQIATKIIQEQEQLMGPVAWHEAGKVKGLKILDKNNGSVAIEDESKSPLIIDDLVRQYEKLFGLAAREVSKEAVTVLLADLSESDIPSTLK